MENSIGWCFAPAAPAQGRNTPLHPRFQLPGVWGLEEGSWKAVGSGWKVVGRVVGRVVGSQNFQLEGSWKADFLWNLHRPIGN